MPFGKCVHTSSSLIWGVNIEVQEQLKPSITLPASNAPKSLNQTISKWNCQSTINHNWYSDSRIPNISWACGHVETDGLSMGYMNCSASAGIARMQGGIRQNHARIQQ